MGKVPWDCPKEQWKEDEPCSGIRSFPYDACLNCRVPISRKGGARFPTGLTLPLNATSEEIEAALKSQVVIVYPELKRRKFTFPFFGYVVGKLR